MCRAKLTPVLALLNVVLIGVVLWQARLLRQPKEESKISEPRRLQTNAVVQSSSSASARDRPVAQPPGTSPATAAAGITGWQRFQAGPSASATNRPALSWQQVESEDYRTYLKNLRAIGCPEQTVHDIVAADVLQAFAARRAEAVAARYSDFKFWKADQEESAAREGLERQRRALDEEMTGTLRELLGLGITSPSTASEWRQAALGQQLAFLPPDKSVKTEAVLLQYAGVDDQIHELSWGHRTPEDPSERQHVIEAYDRKRAELGALLTPEEYERVDLTVSWTADNLRRAMANFHPTEEEFRAIFREWRAHDESLARLFATGQPDPGNEPVFGRIRELLGEQRYAQYRSTWWK